MRQVIYERVYDMIERGRGVTYRSNSFDMTPNGKAHPDTDMSRGYILLQSQGGHLPIQFVRYDTQRKGKP